MPSILGRRRPRVVARALGLSASALAMAALLAWTPQPASGWNQGAAEGTLWQLLNGARVNNGMAPLQQHGTLVSLARWRSSDMIQRDYFSHTIAGSGCEVYCYYDSNGLSYVWAGENIGWNSGQTDDYSPVRVHEQFMNSSGHRANVLNAAFTHGGVGAYAADNVQFQGYVQNPRMYTELFMQAAAAPPPPPPSSGGGWAPAPAPAPAAPGGGYTPPQGGGAAPAPAAPAEPEPQEMHVAAPQPPSGGERIDGMSTLIARASFAPRLAAARLAADDALGFEHGASKRSTTVVVQSPSGMRVDQGAPAQQGIFESVLGSILGFFFG